MNLPELLNRIQRSQTPFSFSMRKCPRPLATTLIRLKELWMIGSWTMSKGSQLGPLTTRNINVNCSQLSAKSKGPKSQGALTKHSQNIPRFSQMKGPKFKPNVKEPTISRVLQSRGATKPRGSRACKIRSKCEGPKGYPKLGKGPQTLKVRWSTKGTLRWNGILRQDAAQQVKGHLRERAFSVPLSFGSATPGWNGVLKALGVQKSQFQEPQNCLYLKQIRRIVKNAKP